MDEPQVKGRDAETAAETAEKLGTPAIRARVGDDPAGPPPERVATGAPAAVAGGTPEERSAALNAAVPQYLDMQRPANTTRTYERAWRMWEDFTAELGIWVVDGSPGALVAFVAWLEKQGYAPSTIESRLTGAIVGLRRYGAAVTKQASTSAREEIRNYRRRLGEEKIDRGRGQARAVTAEHVRAMSWACPDTSAGLRDRALLLIGFTIGARASELAALHCHELVDEPGGRGIVVRIPVTKTGTEHHDPVLPWQADSGTCAVRAWHAWRAAAAITEGPALRPVDRWDHSHPVNGLSAKAVTEIIAAAGRRAELPFPVTEHSLRHGFATTARQGGATDVEIADQGRWARDSSTLKRYLHEHDQWTNTAAGKLGL